MKEMPEAIMTMWRTDTVLKRNMILVVLAALFVAGVAWLSGWGALGHAGDIQRLFAAWRSHGFAGPLSCIALQALQVVVFFIPGEVLSFAAGYAFGTWHGLLYSFAGIMAGSVFNFCLARAVGRSALSRIVKTSSLDRVDRLLGDGRGRFAIFTLFLLPMAPTDALCYGAGFTGMSLPEFAAISGVARIPSLLLNIYLGARAATHNWIFLILAGLLFLAVFTGYSLLAGRGTRRATPAGPHLGMGQVRGSERKDLLP